MTLDSIWGTLLPQNDYMIEVLGHKEDLSFNELKLICDTCDKAY